MDKQDPIQEPTNSRQLRQADDRAFLKMVLFSLLVVGSAVIGLVYGWQALLTAVPILLIGAAAILLPWGALKLLEKWRDRIDA